MTHTLPRFERALSFFFNVILFVLVIVKYASLPIIGCFYIAGIL